MVKTKPWLIYCLHNTDVPMTLIVALIESCFLKPILLQFSISSFCSLILLHHAWISPADNKTGAY